jgi:predicted RNA-binding Zn-ribbon protein involved in translation (DUF1610 family)
MKCDKCGSPMLCEDLGDRKKKYSCPKCGEAKVLDEQGRKLLNE